MPLPSASLDRARLLLVSPCARRLFHAAPHRCRGLRQRRPAQRGRQGRRPRSRKQEFNHWLTVAAQRADRSRAAPGGRARSRRTSPSASRPSRSSSRPKGQQKPTDGAAEDPVPAGVRLAARSGHAVPDLRRVDPAGGRRAGREGHDAEVRSGSRTEEAVFPKEKDYQKFLKPSGHDRGGLLFRVKLDVLPDQVRRRSPRTRTRSPTKTITGVLRQEQGALRPPERRDLNVVLTKTEAKAERGQGGDRVGQELQDGREEVLDRRGVQVAGRQAAGVAKGQQEKALRRRVFARQEAARRPGQDPVRLLRLRGHKVTKASQQSLAQAKDDDPQPAALAARAEGARRVRQGLPREVQGRDQLRGGLRHRRVQERSEGRRRTPARPPAGQPRRDAAGPATPAAARHAARRSTEPA